MRCVASHAQAEGMRCVASHAHVVSPALRACDVSPVTHIMMLRACDVSPLCRQSHWQAGEPGTRRGHRLGVHTGYKSACTQAPSQRAHRLGVHTGYKSGVYTGSACTQALQAETSACGYRQGLYRLSQGGSPG